MQDHRNVLYMFQAMSPGFRLHTDMLNGCLLPNDSVETGTVAQWTHVIVAVEK